MKQPTTEQMVKELDEKFEGFADVYKGFLEGRASTFKQSKTKGVDVRGCLHETYLTFGSNPFPQGHEEFRIEFIHDPKDFISYNESLRFLVRKAHDYFITKGGEL